MVLNCVSAAVVWAIMARISGLDPSSEMIAPRYLKLLTQSSFSPLALIVVLISLVLLVEVFSSRSTKLASSSSFPARPSMSSAKRKFVIVLPPMLGDNSIQ